MASVNEIVRESILTEPMLFANRTEVLHYILCIPGAAYSWDSNGEIFASGWERPHWTPMASIEMAQRLKETMLPEVFELVRESLESKCSDEIDVCSDRVLRIDELVETRGEIENPYQQTANISLLAKMPEYVTDEWRAACLEIQETMKTYGWTF